ncbi:MAG: GWxTD domain-containing protein [Gemmatimonadetes bacterium]|nr:GWxTD domain-containing protein [Gemmatimonadota bacterium]
MVSYLRYFATPGRLRLLESAAPEQRARVWSDFVREVNSGAGPAGMLQAYFLRIESANLRFRDEGTPGWLTDRGMVYITLGEPDQLREPTAMDMNQRGRVQIWDYNAKRLQLVFVDQTGFGRWKLTPASMADFQSVARSVQEQGRR